MSSARDNDETPTARRSEWMEDAHADVGLAMGASVDRRSAPIAELLSVNDAVDLFGKSERTIRRWIANGTLKVFRVGHSVFIPSDHIRELISASMLSGARPRAETK